MYRYNHNSNANRPMNPYLPAAPSPAALVSMNRLASSTPRFPLARIASPPVIHPPMLSRLNPITANNQYQPIHSAQDHVINSTNQHDLNTMTFTSPNQFQAYLQQYHPHMPVDNVNNGTNNQVQSNDEQLANRRAESLDKDQLKSDVLSLLFETANSV